MANILPLELVDKCIGSQIWILMKEEREVVGILRGFDDYLSIKIINRHGTGRLRMGHRQKWTQSCSTGITSAWYIIYIKAGAGR